MSDPGTKVLLEVVVDSLQSLEAALDGGADRIELCSALGIGGLTPSLGLMQAASAATVPVYALIRPRAGDFVYDTSDLVVMRADIDAARDNGMAGVVVGANLASGALDLDMLEALVLHADGLGRTLHRAFDMTGDGMQAALDQAVDLEFERILTSGGAESAPVGVARLKDLFGWAAGRIGIMPGAGITADSAARLAAELPLREIHGSCSAIVAGHGDCARLGFLPHRLTNAAQVRAMKAAVGRG
jgi:copper homeostasis protein